MKEPNGIGPCGEEEIQTAFGAGMWGGKLPSTWEPIDAEMSEACTALVEGHLPTRYWPYDQVVTECWILRPRAMQVVNCAAGHGQQRRQAVARRDSMAASTANSLENK